MKQLIACLLLATSPLAADSRLRYQPPAFHPEQPFVDLLHKFFPLFSPQSTVNTNVTFKGVNSPPTYYTTPESFGAIGDNSHDDTTAINSAIASLISANLCSGVVSCQVQFEAKTYKTTAAVTISGSYVTLIGASMVGSSILSDTATTGDLLNISGSGAACAAAGAGLWNSVIRMQLSRPTPATAGTGINLTNACWTKVIDVQITDSFSAFYINGSGLTKLQDTQASFSTSSGSTRSGYEIDTTSAEASSTVFERTIVDASGSRNVIGLNFHGACIADFSSDHFETAGAEYGIKITSTANPGTYSLCNGNVHFVNPQIDNSFTAGIQVNSLFGGGVPFVDFDGGYVRTQQNAVPCVDIENSAGILVRGMTLACFGTSGIGVKIAGGNSNTNTIALNKLDLSPTAVSVNGSGNHIITNNQCSGIASHAVTTCFGFVGSSGNTLTSNVASGTFTTSVAFDATSNNNQLSANLFTPSTISNAGAGNNLGNIGTFTIAGLPACSSSLLGAQAFVTNGQNSPLYYATVSTTGPLFYPVICINSGGPLWVYY